MLCVPTARLDVVHAAVRELPLSVNTIAEQLEIDVLPSWKLTLPVGALPVTVAVSVTLAPTMDGFCELATLVLLAAAVMPWESAELVDAPLPASPP